MSAASRGRENAHGIFVCENIMVNVACYIDGFNMYHSIDEGNRASGYLKGHLKWVDLYALMKRFTDPAIHTVQQVKFFTAYPVWNPAKLSRHQNYVAALRHTGVTIVEGKFKTKDSYCKNCRTTYQGREEKESDVNIAMHLINDAHCGVFDQAFLVTNDSDLLGPVRMLRNTIPDKKIKVIAPPFRRHSKELWAAANGRAKIGEAHLLACLLPIEAFDGAGNVIFRRPNEYAIPV
ncbi:NYN domain-containing protein [Cypionkella sinensis]|uniref:NYN domain-containing protein n=1 Tax=Cypionkella sinensis TaxID=1756043 RepID=A0ABV7IYV5_9RHOB